jgi:preprotein translocase subunit SecE
VTAFFQELFHVGLYKRSQGKIARQATFFALLVIIALGSWRLHVWMGGIGTTAVAATEAEAANPALDVLSRTRGYTIPLAVLIVGSWIAFRVVQLPGFADFLISVEAEMNKVSWPSRSELFRATVVVILTIFLLSALLATYDVILQSIPAVWNWLVTSLTG